MKKFNLFAAAVAVSVMGGAAVSCNKPETPSPEPQPQPVEKNLPELQDVSVDPGKSKEITFYAYGAWTVEVDKIWCTPDKTSGEKGDNKVVFSVADAFEAAETAKVTLTIGEDKDVVTFNITRNAKEREFSITGADDAAVTSITFGEDAKSVEIKVKANFWWQLDAADDCNAQWPLWLSKPSPRFEGKAGDIVTVTLTVDEEQLPNFYDSKEGMIWFNDVENPDVKYSINVKHTFEKPVFLSSDRGTSLRLDMTNNFYDIDGKTTTDRSVTFKMTPEPGEVNYQVYMYVDKVFYGPWPPIQGNTTNTFYHGLDQLNVAVEQNSNVWITLNETETNTYTLVVKDTAIDPITRNTTVSLGKGYGYTDKVYYFVVPASVYGNFLPNASGLASMRDRFFDSSTNTVNEDMQKYLIEVVCDNPYTGIAE